MFWNRRKKDTQSADSLTEEAIAILRAAPVRKRVGAEAQPPTIARAFKLFQQAALRGGSAVEHYNFAVCCYYLNLWQSGMLNFGIALDHAKQKPTDPESRRVVRFHAAFWAHVCELREVWLFGDLLVNADFFISRTTPGADVPGRRELDPNVLL